MIGPETLRLRLEHRRGEYTEEYGRYAEMWLIEKDAEATAIDRERYRTIRRWAIIAGSAGTVAAVAGLIAAWPALGGWISIVLRQ